MPKPLHIEVVREPHADAEREAALAVDALADAPADRLIARARREVAGERVPGQEWHFELIAGAEVAPAAPRTLPPSVVGGGARYRERVLF